MSQQNNSSQKEQNLRILEVEIEEDTGNTTITYQDNQGNVDIEEAPSYNREDYNHLVGKT